MGRNDQLQGVEMRFFIDYYDGPLSGVAQYAEADYWFEAEGRQDEAFALKREDRRFFLYPIAPEEPADEEHWKRLYEEHVGGDKPESGKWQFYEPYAKRHPPHYASREPIGWFSVE